MICFIVHLILILKRIKANILYYIKGKSMFYYILAIYLLNVDYNIDD